MGEIFGDQVQRILSSFSQKDIHFFAWLCAVRALPFLGVNGSFDYWIHKGDDKRQHHILSVLKAIDDIAVNGSGVYYSAVENAAKDAYNADAKTAAAAATAVAYATYSIINTYYADEPYDSIFADSSAAASAANATNHAADKQIINLRSILLDDLENIKVGKRLFQNDTTIYGKIWDNFQGALRDLGCEYWGDWYAKVFAKGFMLDDTDCDEIKLRLNVPSEIMVRGAAEVARYTMELKGQGAVRLNEFRVIILGDKGSGKTSLAMRLKNPISSMPTADASTEGVDVIDWFVPSDPSQPVSGATVHIWDFAGHVITHAAHRCFMSERCLYILVVDGRIEGDNRVEYWLEQIRNYGGNSPVLVLVNIRNEHHVDLHKNTLKKEFPSIEGFHQVNICVGGEPLKVFRQTVLKHLWYNPLWKDQQISAPAYKVKEALRQKFTQGNNFITLDDFEQIAKNNCVMTEEYEQLLKDLSDLGICLWYKDDDMREVNTLMLNPNWISHGIYRLITWGIENRKSALSVSDFREVFKGIDALTYPEEKVGFLFSLMKTYQLAFFKSTTEIFVPLLLPVDRPKAEYLPEFVFGDRLCMEYCASQALPPYTVARLAAVRSKDLDRTRSWRFGAVLIWKPDTTDKHQTGEEIFAEALVEENERARSVIVYVKGSKKTEYISQLRSTLNSIFDSYKSSFPQLTYEVFVPASVTHKLQPLFLSEETIKGHLIRRRDYFEPNTGVLIPVDDILKKYNIDARISINYDNTNIINFTRIPVSINEVNILSNLAPELLREARLICIGDADAGKTTLIERLVTKKWKQTEGPTRGIAIRSTIIDDPEPFDLKRILGLNYWDFGGQDIMHSMHQYFMAERCLYIIVLDGRRDEKPEYWLDLVSMYGGHSPVMIVMNKIDHNNNARINEEKIREIYGRKLMHISFHYLSCKEETGLADFQIELLRTIKLMECYQKVFSKNWNQVRQHVRYMRDANGIPKNYLSIEEYENICKKHSIDEKDVYVLLGWLHDMGVCLSYQHIHTSGVVEKIKVLQPEWITNGIYKIINDKRATIRHGFVTHQMLRTILEENDGENIQFRNIECDFILEMMRIFQYSYSVGDAEFFPMLTSIEKPPLPLIFTNTETITYRIRFTSLLPMSVLHNVIVRLREDVQPSLTWREGTFLSNNEVHAQLAFGEDRKIIDIKVAGSREDAARYLSRLLAEIHRVLLYIDVEWTEFVVVTHENVNAELDIERLQKMYAKGIREEYVKEFNEVMLILPILRNIMPQLVIDKLQNAVDDADTIREILKVSCATHETVKMMRQQIAQTYASIQEISNQVRSNEKYAAEICARLNVNLNKILQCIENIKKDAADNYPEIRNAINEVYIAVKNKNQRNLLTKLLTLVGHTANLYGVYGLGLQLLNLIS